MHKPTQQNMQILKRVLRYPRYLKGTLHQGIQVFKDLKFELKAYMDSDRAGDKDDCTSTSAYNLFGSHTNI